VSDHPDKRDLPSPFSTGVSGSCPRCGEGKLFSGLLETRKGCNACGLDYGFADSGDGPAVFVILILGFIIVGMALAVDANYGWPLWLHMLVWLPLLTVMGLWGLRAGKGIFIAVQYQNNAREGQRDHNSESENE